MDGETYKYDLQNRGLLGHLREANPFAAAKIPSASPQCATVCGRQAKANWLAQQQQQQIQNRGRDSGYQSVKCGRLLSLPQSSWPTLQVYHQNQPDPPNGSGSRAVLNGGSGAKRGCAGTGVFLPRQYANPPEPRKKTSNHSRLFCNFLFLVILEHFN